MRKRLVILYLILTMVLAVGCSSRRPAQPVQHSSASPAAVPALAPKPVDLARTKPNELGKVMILEYHDVAPAEARWARQVASFRSDLQRLYDLGYRPVSLRDYVNNNIALPAGVSPVVLTFDDSTQGQFNYIYESSRRKVDPDCAVAVMEEFHRTHPDWPLEATFYVYYPVPFRQKELIEKKLRRIIELGMDIGNHTYSHVRLDQQTDIGAAREMALGAKETLQYAPGAVVDSIALPYGKGPRNKGLLVSGEYEGQKYHNIAALLVGAEPAPSPVSPDFDPYRLPRIQAIQSELDTWLGYFKKHPENRYVSDGDPDTVTVPKQLAGGVDTARLDRKTLRTY